MRQRNFTKAMKGLGLGERQALLMTPNTQALLHKHFVCNLKKDATKLMGILYHAVR